MVSVNLNKCHFKLITRVITLSYILDILSQLFTVLHIHSIIEFTRNKIVILSFKRFFKNTNNFDNYVYNILARAVNSKVTSFRS